MILIFADPHLHDYPEAVTRPGCASRLRDVADALDWVLQVGVEAHVTDIICAGDLLHDRKTGARPEVLHHLGVWLAAVHDAGVALTLLVGNHDMSLDGACTSLAALCGSATVVSKPSQLEFGGHQVGFLPYTADPAAAEASCRALKGCRYLVGHVGLGDPNCAPADYEVPGCMTLSSLCVQQFDKVFLGHYHLHQEVTPSVMYVGSPLQLSFGEAGHPKGCILLDVDSGSARFVENEVSPRHHIVATAEDAAACPSRDFVWVRAADRAEEDAAKALGRSNIRIDRAVGPSDPPRIAPNAKRAELFRDYVRAVQPDLLQHEVDDLVAAGMAIWKDSRG